LEPIKPAAPVTRIVRIVASRVKLDARRAGAYGTALLMELDKLYNGDCISGMAQIPEGSVDLAFADPPFNIGYKYDVYEDRLAADEYLNWTKKWGKALVRTLKPDRHLLACHRRRLRRGAKAPLSARTGAVLPELGDLVLHIRRQLQIQIQPQPHAFVSLCEGSEEVYV
jgi:hypothetical protein